MSEFYLANGTIQFPSGEGPATWRKTAVTSWKGKGRVTVSQVLEWETREALLEDDAPAEYANAFFLEVVESGSAVTIRGLIHENSVDAITALLEEAASLGAEANVVMQSLDDPHHSSLSLRISNEALRIQEGASDIPEALAEGIVEESNLRAQRLLVARTCLAWE
ncbi:MAG: hypothetical protein LBE83_10330 [Propionibacteriaceae bacterium]|jgi:hypothetical protein|nr:hypothetical protein [Propionibacteriaceae bacterium]